MFKNMWKYIWPSNYEVKITREGKIFSGLIALIAAAALNTGNNLLYLILSMVSSFIIVSGILSTLSLRKIQVHRTPPEYAFARTSFSVKATIVNRKRLFPSFSLWVEDLSQNLSVQRKAYFIKVPAKGEVTLPYTLAFSRRGLHEMGGLKVSTGYPFGLCVRAKTFNLQDSLLVYPKISPIADLQTSSTLLEGDSYATKKGTGTDFNGIRDYTPGDNSRLIHWKTTAKLAKFMVKEFEDESRKRVSLMVDTSHSPVWEIEAISANLVYGVDRTMDTTASFAWHFIHQNFQVQLITPLETISFNQGQAHLFKILRVLALFPSMGVSTNQNSRVELMTLLEKLNGANGLGIFISLDGKWSVVRGRASMVGTNGHSPLRHKQRQLVKFVESVGYNKPFDSAQGRQRTTDNGQ